MDRLTPFGFLGTSLNDMIRGLRHADDPPAFIRRAVDACRHETRSPHLSTKTQAVLKLAYLEMLGVDATWAMFHVVEVMASPAFQQKRIGYLAMQSFRDEELLVLVTNLVKNDLVSRNLAVVGVALSGLATAVSPLLASETVDDVLRMLSHSRPYIRNKAVLALRGLVRHHPEALTSVIGRLGDLLGEEDASIVGTAVSVVLELAGHNGHADLVELTPKLFAVFSKSEHNWTLIKLLKIFRLFALKEPRLGTKLKPAILAMMESKGAALVYESAQTLVFGGMADTDVAAKVVALAPSDPNLVFIWTRMLVGLAQREPRWVPKDVVLELLLVDDPLIRKEALNLAVLTADDCLVEYVEILARQPTPDATQAVCVMVAKENYQYVPDFEWLVEVLGGLAKKCVVPGLAERLLDVALRVNDEDVRRAVARVALDWLRSGSDVAFAEVCWWLVGEYSPKGVGALVKEVGRQVEEEEEESPWARVNTAVSNTGLNTVNTVSNTVDYVNTVESEGLPASAELPRLSAGHPALPATSSGSPADPTGQLEGHPALLSALTPAACTCIAKLTLPSDLSLSLALLAPGAASADFELQERSAELLELFRLAAAAPAQRANLLGGLDGLFRPELAPVAKNAQRVAASAQAVDLRTPVAGVSRKRPSGEIFPEAAEVPKAAQPQAVATQSQVAAQAVATPAQATPAQAKADLFDLSKLERRKKVAMVAEDAPVGAKAEVKEKKEKEKKEKEENKEVKEVKVKRKKRTKQLATNETSIS